MRNLYREYFHIPKDGKIREKVMLARIATTVVIVVLCLAAMGFTAYAYFSVDLTYGSNTITAANFDVEVSIVSEGEEVAVFRNGRSYLADLEAGKAYTVTLTHTGTAQTGFVILSATDCDDTYYTTQLGQGGELTFTVEVNAPTTVSFLGHWGTSSYYDKYKETGNTFFIQEEGSVSLAVNVDEEITDEEPSAAEQPEEQSPSVSAPENVTPSKPETQKPSEPAEGSAQEPSKEPAETPAEPVEPEPTEEPTDPEAPVEYPADPVDPEEPAEEPAEPGEFTEPETPGEETAEPSDPVEETPETPEEPTGEPVDGSVDAPVDEPTGEPVGEPVDEPGE